MRRIAIAAAALAPALWAAPPPHSEWKLTFSDEFDGPVLDASKWNNGYALEATGPGSWPDPANVRLEGGSLRLYGEKRAQRPPDELHPLGYGREIYFWSFVVALLIFTAGAGVSVYEGILHMMKPEMLHSPAINFAVLGVSFVIEGGSTFFALRTISDVTWSSGSEST